MYDLSALAKVTHHEKLRATARDHLSHQAYAPRRAGNRSTLARRLADLHVLRGRRTARAY